MLFRTSYRKAALPPGNNKTELHALGHLDAKDAHTETHHLGYIGTEHQTEVALVGILLAKDGEVMIELVVFLHQFVAVVSDDGRTVVLTGGTHHIGKFRNPLDEGLFLGAEVDICG